MISSGICSQENEVDTYEMYHKTISDVYLETIPKMLEYGFGE